jgi:hypothetical protein
MNVRSIPQPPSVQLTVINIFRNCCLNCTFVPIRNRLCLERRAVDIAVVVHSLLQRVILPAKDVVPMRSISSGVSVAPDEWLRAISRPKRLVVEFRGIPYDLEEELWDLDRMSRRTRAVVFKCSAAWVGDVALVVGTVEIYSIPAADNFVSASEHFEGKSNYLTHVGKRRFAMIPDGQGAVGISIVSGARVIGVCKHV